MTDAGILDASGKLTIPPTELISSDPEGPYEKFRNWLTKDSPSLLDKAASLAEGIDRALDECGSKSS